MKEWIKAIPALIIIAEKITGAVGQRKQKPAGKSDEKQNEASQLAAIVQQVGDIADLQVQMAELQTRAAITLNRKVNAIMSIAGAILFVAVATAGRVFGIW